MRKLSFVIALAIYWLGLSGHYTTMLLGLGLASVLLVVWIAQRMDLIDLEGHPTQLSLRMPGYWSWLSKEVIVSSLAVCGRVLRGGHRPAVGRIPIYTLSQVGTATLANSITLTPGTLALRVVDDCVEVHALDISGLEDLRSDRLPARVRLFDRAPELEAMPEPNPRPDAAAQAGQAESADGQPESADGQPAAADRRPGDHDA